LEVQEIGIQQLHVSYDKVQDRLLFRVGLSDETEIALWFTYRFSKKLWTALNSEAHLPESKSFANEQAITAISQFQQEVEAMEALKKLDFATEYQPREAMRSEQELLAVSFTLSEDAKHLEMTCLEEVAVNINLTPELILAICNMLQLATKEAGWEIAGAIPAIVIDASSASKVLH
jgi:hypothetical protein